MTAVGIASLRRPHPLRGDPASDALWHQQTGRPRFFGFAAFGSSAGFRFALFRGFLFRLDAAVFALSGFSLGFPKPTLTPFFGGFCRSLARPGAADGVSRIDLFDHLGGCVGGDRKADAGAAGL